MNITWNARVRYPACDRHGAAAGRQPAAQDCFQEGWMVKAGDVLAQIDPRTFRLRPSSAVEGPGTVRCLRTDSSA
jgi:hypothetical protein